MTVIFLAIMRALAFIFVSIYIVLIVVAVINASRPISTKLVRVRRYGHRHHHQIKGNSFGGGNENFGGSGGEDQGDSSVSAANAQASASAVSGSFGGSSKGSSGASGGSGFSGGQEIGSGLGGENSVFSGSSGNGFGVFGPESEGGAESSLELGGTEENNDSFNNIKKDVNGGEGIGYGFSGGNVNFGGEAGGKQNLGFGGSEGTKGFIELGSSGVSSDNFGEENIGLDPGFIRKYGNNNSLRRNEINRSLQSSQKFESASSDFGEYSHRSGLAFGNKRGYSSGSGSGFREISDRNVFSGEKDIGDGIAGDNGVIAGSNGEGFRGFESGVGHHRSEGVMGGGDVFVRKYGDFSNVNNINGGPVPFEGSGGQINTEVEPESGRFSSAKAQASASASASSLGFSENVGHTGRKESLVFGESDETNGFVGPQEGGKGPVSLGDGSSGFSSAPNGDIDGDSFTSSQKSASASSGFGGNSQGSELTFGNKRGYGLGNSKGFGGSNLGGSNEPESEGVKGDGDVFIRKYGDFSNVKNVNGGSVPFGGSDRHILVNREVKSESSRFSASNAQASASASASSLGFSENGGDTGRKESLGFGGSDETSGFLGPQEGDEGPVSLGDGIRGFSSGSNGDFGGDSFTSSQKSASASSGFGGNSQGSELTFGNKRGYGLRNGKGFGGNSDANGLVFGNKRGYGTNAGSNFGGEPGSSDGQFSYSGYDKSSSGSGSFSSASAASVSGGGTSKHGHGR